MKFKKVITHSGVFHADEITAITLLRLTEAISYGTPIERVREVSSEDLQDKNVLVLDVGRQFDGESNFDHHQDPNLPASNVLVLEAFVDDEKLMSVLKSQFFNAVSDIDRGIEKAKPASYSQIISNFNMVNDGWAKALQYAEDTLGVVWLVASESVRLEEKWDGLRVVNNFKLQEDKEFIPNWKELAKKEGIRGLICPNSREGWQVVVPDSDVETIPEKETQTFRHNSGFMAVYPSRELCLEHVKGL
jgi:uncharacterized UPF0160 family protein